VRKRNGKKIARHSKRWRKCKRGEMGDLKYCKRLQIEGGKEKAMPVLKQHLKIFVHLTSFYHT
jgi:hypothetical protein